MGAYSKGCGFESWIQLYISVSLGYCEEKKDESKGVRLDENIERQHDGPDPYSGEQSLGHSALKKAQKKRLGRF